MVCIPEGHVDYFDWVGYIDEAELNISVDFESRLAQETRGDKYLRSFWEETLGVMNRITPETQTKHTDRNELHSSHSASEDNGINQAYSEDTHNERPQYGLAPGQSCVSHGMDRDCIRADIGPR